MLVEPRRPRDREASMWWGIGFGAILYCTLLLTLGIACANRGRWWLFGFGMLFPILWLIGVLLPSKETQAAQRLDERPVWVRPRSPAPRTVERNRAWYERAATVGGTGASRTEAEVVVRAGARARCTLGLRVTGAGRKEPRGRRQRGCGQVTAGNLLDRERPRARLLPGNPALGGRTLPAQRGRRRFGRRRAAECRLAEGSPERLRHRERGTGQPLFAQGVLQLRVLAARPLPAGRGRPQLERGTPQL